jgi:formylglycine-generating enzyme required for sulfatase activity
MIRTAGGCVRGLAVGWMLWAGCGGAPGTTQSPAAAARAPLSLAADDHMIDIPAGRYIAGSTPEERAAAYDDHSNTAGNDTAHTERWFEREADRHSATLPGFRLDLMPVTQAQFAEFVAAEHVAPPAIDEAAWQAQGLADFARLAPRFVWRDGSPPPGREDHPVVLVPWADADRYCRWRGEQRGQRRRLPTADELEKAARGDGGMAYPWGNLYEPDKLNSAVHGPGDTTPVGSYVTGASPYGVLDLAGNVYHWTATAAPSSDQVIIKGSAWRDFAGLGRGAWFDRRARTTAQIVVGFRCAADAP